jgi:hypothetical protein
MSGEQRPTRQQIIEGLAEMGRQMFAAPTAAEREQWERDDEAEGKATARAAEPDVEP